MRDLGCHPDLFQLAVVKKQTNQQNKKREKGRWDKMEKKKTKEREEQGPFVKNK